MHAVEFLAALRRGTTLVAPCTPTKPTWRAWVAITSPTRDRERPGLRNRDLELIWVTREWDPDYVANDLCWAEGDGMATLERTTTTGEEELRDLAERNGGPVAFCYPWHTDFPG
ncbi:hypothetical protein OH805_16960 [Streptomyces sp. NBC_00879]|uniref:hypothetical protein n=1 Tax=Streptomyces sp. NBC_00879 TaxID=2975855 RepID=UPI00386E9694|nr:hypothetical protein OH805_16960 [Streptomyces sp. NBC_00879]